MVDEQHIVFGCLACSCMKAKHRIAYQPLLISCIWALQQYTVELDYHETSCVSVT